MVEESIKYFRIGLTADMVEEYNVKCGYVQRVNRVAGKEA